MSIFEISTLDLCAEIEYYSNFFKRGDSFTLTDTVTSTYDSTIFLAKKHSSMFSRLSGTCENFDLHDVLGSDFAIDSLLRARATVCAGKFCFLFFAAMSVHIHALD